MKKLLFAVLVGILLVAGCTQSSGNPPVATKEVKISNFAFVPQAITIKAGDTVTWTNEDSVPHDVASNPHPTHTDLPGLRSGELQKGQSYNFTFTQAGTWGYHCHLHPSMAGTVVVEEG